MSGNLLRWGTPVLVLLVLGMFILPAHPQTGDGIVIGSKKFTESVLLGEILVDLSEHAGKPTRHQQQLGASRVVWEALLGGDIDAYPEYTGTIDNVLFPDRKLETLKDIRKALASKNIGITRPLGFNNTYAIAMRKTRARKLGVETISDLNQHPDLTLGFTNAFMDREDGWPGLRDAYNLPHENVQGLDHDLAYQGIANGSIDVIDAYTTDPEIEYHDLELLEDDRSYFPTYRAVVLYREDLRRTAPGVVENFQLLEGAISARQMSRLNKKVKIEGQPSGEVAANFLESEFELDTSYEGTTLVQRLIKRTIEHLFLVGVSLFAAIVLAIPLGIWSAHSEYFGQAILGSVGILQTIPSLALLVFMIPFFGIGTKPALVALFLYSLLPIVRNTHAGLNDIEPEIIESAKALGLAPLSILWNVELPIATRSILAGVKTSAVINVGVATLGALIGAGGYGQPILTGIRLDNMATVLEGAIPAALLALAVQGLLDLLGKFLIPAGLLLEQD